MEDFNASTETSSPAVAEPSSPSEFSDFLNSTQEATEETTSEETTSAETEQEQQTEEQTEPVEGDFDAEIGAPTVVDGPDGTKLYQYSQEQSTALQSNSRFAAELRAAIPDITVNDAVAHSQAFTDLSRMVNDMRRGSEQSVDRFAQMIVGQGKGGFVPSLAKSLVNHIRTNDSAAYEQIRGPVEQELGEEFFGLARKAANHPDKNVREGYRMLAQMFHYHMTGGETREVGTAEQADPLADRLKTIEARERAIQEADQEREQAQTTAWVGAAKVELANSLSNDIDEAMKPYADRFGKNPAMLKLVKTGIIAQVKEAIAGDKDWRTRFDMQYETAQEERSKESAQRVINFYSARVRGILKNQLPKMISSASNGAISENRERRQQLERASSSSHRVPGATGAPARQSIVQQPGKFKSPADYAAELDRMMTA